MLRVKELREARGWTQAQLAEAAGVAQSLISDLEAGKRASRYTTLMRIAKALGVSLSELTSEEVVNSERTRGTA